MGKAIYIKSVTQKISEEFSDFAKSCFGDNLAFCFICGGVSKGYATSLDHDIDMFVCLKGRNLKQEEDFKQFYFNIHEKYGFKADYKDPVEFASYQEIREALNHVSKIKLAREMKTYRDYEAIVWCDMFYGATIGDTGNLQLLQNVKQECYQYPEMWRTEIIKNLSEAEILEEGHLVELKKALVDIALQKRSEVEIVDEGGVENLKNAPKDILLRLSGVSGEEHEKIVNYIDKKDKDEIFTIGMNSLLTKPVTLLFEKYVNYAEKQKPVSLSSRVL